MLEAWQDLLNEPIDTSGYDLAYQHYTDLKNKMIDQIMANAKKKLSAQSYDKFQDDVENLILQDGSKWGEAYGKAQQALQNIEDGVAKIIEDGDTSGITQTMSNINEKIQAKNLNVKQSQKMLKSELRKNQDLIFNELGIDNNFIINMLATSNTNGDISSLISQASSYLVRYLYESLFGGGSIASGSKFKYAMSMGGFYKELAEYETLYKALDQYINTYHSGGIHLSGGKESEMDLFFSQAVDAVEGLNQNVMINQYISAFEEPPGSKDLMQELMNKIDFFGEQVKSRTLGKSLTFSIGHRAELYSSFLAENGANPYSSLQALHFLARFKNILLSLGPANVLFSSNGQRQWMADFISTFREQSYLLSFLRSSDKDPLTNHVGLEQLYSQSKKSIRRRFQ